MKDGPSMVPALISISGHGPAVRTVNVPHTVPTARKNRSRRRGGNSCLVTHRAYPSGLFVRLDLTGPGCPFRWAERRAECEFG